jgi:hypothetical protein
MEKTNPLLGKVEFKIGSVCFSAEGDQEWVAQQLNTVIEAASKAPGALDGAAGEPAAPVRQDHIGKTNAPETNSISLASYLKTKGADSNQTKRFLATAAWLRGRGQQEITSSDVSKALKDNHQNRLGNAADCLNKNVSKGFCEKSGKSFFITPEGLTELGEINGAV